MSIKSSPISYTLASQSGSLRPPSNASNIHDCTEEFGIDFIAHTAGACIDPRLLHIPTIAHSAGASIDPCQLHLPTSITGPEISNLRVQVEVADDDENDQLIETDSETDDSSSLDPEVPLARSSFYTLGSLSSRPVKNIKRGGQSPELKFLKGSKKDKKNRRKQPSSHRRGKTTVTPVAPSKRATRLNQHSRRRQSLSPSSTSVSTLSADNADEDAKDDSSEYAPGSVLYPQATTKSASSASKKGKPVRRFGPVRQAQNVSAQRKYRANRKREKNVLESFFIEARRLHRSVLSPAGFQKAFGQEVERCETNLKSTCVKTAQKQSGAVDAA